jgi:hypothetical protein
VLATVSSKVSFHEHRGQGRFETVPDDVRHDDNQALSAFDKVVEIPADFFARSIEMGKPITFE